MDCIFCKIIDNQIPAAKVYEDENVYVFLDISQTTKGHTLIIPKKHIKDVFELSSEDAANIYGVVPKITHALKEALNPDGINIVNNNGSAAGQTVFHYHVHLIPRYKNDGFDIKYINNMEHYTKDELSNLANLIKQKI